ncbi:glycosyltransferase [Salinisphaera sp.]|uniref:glycosyltransferase n=1 Tax=Salinisphaera sp. TaxID=1914330 RepID=UPI002D7922C6|nr:glycosyltransferase [Salinisphaera sp.]HET7313163.1 glycosyltransferase [Salinisphaera sp.]
MSRLALFTSALTGGGVQRSMANLAVVLARRGHAIDLVVCHGDRETEAALAAAGVRVVVLAATSSPRARILALRAAPAHWRELGPTVLWPVATWSKLAYLAALRDYLVERRPDAMLSAMTQCNLVAIWARTLAGVHTRLVVSERNMLSRFAHPRAKKQRWRHTARLVGVTYPRADAIVGVSNAVADDLAAATGLARPRIVTVVNPTVDDTLRVGALAPCPHPWLDPRLGGDGPPVVLGVSRLVEQKDPSTLLRAFVRLRRGRDARLILLGDGPLREPLRALAESLGVAAHVDLPGWDDRPFAYMANADVFVLPSRWEGLPGVLIQALACGCPAVATDAPGGSAEILEHGRYGRLVPVGDAVAMAHAIAATLDDPRDPGRLKARAEDFSADASADGYLALMLGAGER